MDDLEREDVFGCDMVVAGLGGAAWAVDRTGVYNNKMVLTGQLAGQGLPVGVDEDAAQR